MYGFADEAVIHVASGHGGSGAVSFRREKYVPFGGPDGGDGGKGGDVIFQVKENLRTLSHLKMKPHYKAQTGEGGKGRKKHGRKGDDIYISVPPGTIIRELETGDVLMDFSGHGERTWTLFQGGRGGQGNWHFRSSRRQTPRFAQPGEEGKAADLRVVLNIIADIGFVGFPNAGKSTLLSLLTNAEPKIGSYPFTTTSPNLGMLRVKDHDIVLADIPGIIEGASHGAGMGIQFLKHIARTQGLAILIDSQDEDKAHTFHVLLKELEEYSQELAAKERLVIMTKADLDEDGQAWKDIQEALPGEEIISISSHGRLHLDELQMKFLSLVVKQRGDFL